jgi:hypothetical protein
MIDIKSLTPKEAYRVSQFREARDENARLTYKNIEHNLKLVSGLKLINVETEELKKIEQLF